MTNETSSSIVRPRDVASQCGFCLSTLWGRLNPHSSQFDPAFPRPFRLSSNQSRGAVGWLRADVEGYIKKCAQRSYGGG
ncbi:MAG: hypothetical protein B7Y53_00390 [Halothiobacillus sp. 28-55-5]|nr:MAG: hypothetical protein B7Y53_00390 [Halothiobacillus sp. 28-55-5]